MDHIKEDTGHKSQWVLLNTVKGILGFPRAAGLKNNWSTGTSSAEDLPGSTSVAQGIYM